MLPDNIKNKKGFRSFDYRIGGFYNKSYLVIKNQPIDQKAITLGMGLPTNKKLSTVFIGLELGQYGTKNSGLIQENYMLMSINFGLKDIWFQKVKYY